MSAITHGIEKGTEVAKVVAHRVMGAGRAAPMIEVGQLIHEEVELVLSVGPTPVPKTGSGLASKSHFHYLVKVLS